jgi:hypothetical protein
MKAPVPADNIRKSRGPQRSSKQRLLLGPRPQNGLGEWLAAMVRGLDALEFLERSRELAAEAVVASPARLPTRGG